MTKEEFVTSLKISLEKERLSNIETYLTYYSEMIEDYIEDGFTEKQIFNKIGTIEEVVTTIKEEVGSTDNETSKTNPMITFLLIIGAPLWGSILLTILLFLFSGLVLVWCGPLILGLFSFSGLLIGAISLMGLTFNTGLYYIVTQLGVGIFALGLGILFLCSTVFLTKHVGILSKKIMFILNNLFSWKGKIFS